MISPRGLWFHEFARLAGGLVLDGGMQAWRGALAQGEGPAAAVRSGAALPAGWVVEPALLATVDDVLERDRTRAVLLDVRRRSEHGSSFVHPRFARPGRFPGSTFLFWEDLLDHGRYRTAEDIAARAAAAELSPGQEIINYCHRGRARIFVGSWHQWTERAGLPAELGMTGTATLHRSHAAGTARLDHAAAQPEINMTDAGERSMSSAATLPKSSAWPDRARTPRIRRSWWPRLSWSRIASSTDMPCRITVRVWT
jgi:rhodanese-related sulfurtransferase